MTTIAIFPLFLLLALISVLLLYFFLYRIRVNRSLRENQSEAHVPMASIDSVGRVLTIVGAVLLCIALFTRLTNLHNDIDYLHASMDSEISALQNQIAELEDKIEEQNSLLSDFSYTVGNFDKEALTCDLTLTCAPKSFTDDTAITVTYGSRTIALTAADGGVFRGTERFGIFEALPEQAVITITSDGVSQTQTTDQLPWATLAYEVLPYMDVYCEASATGYRNNTREWDITIRNAAAAWFSSIELVVETNGTETERRALKDSTEELHYSFGEGNTDRIAIYAEGTDEYGIIHRQYLTGYDRDGDILEPDYYEVYLDQNRNILGSIG